MILKEEDYRYLIKDFDEDKDNYQEHVNNEELRELFETISAEYNRLLGGEKDELKKWELLQEIAYKSAIYSFGVEILESYNISGDIEILDVLEGNDDYKYDASLPIKEKLDKIILTLKRIKNALNILRLKYDTKYKPDENVENKFDDLINDLDQTAMVFEIDLKLGYKIDLKETSVLRWVNFVNAKEAKDKAHENNKIT